jgi:hypothetical protein
MQLGKILRASWLVLCFVVCAAAGFFFWVQWAPARAGGGVGSSKETTKTVNAPGASGVETTVKLIRSAEHEVLVCTRQIDSNDVLNALSDEVGSGRRVLVLLSPDTNPSPNEGVIRWLRNNRVTEIYVDRLPDWSQFIMVDRRVLVTYDAPLSGSDPDAGIVVFSTAHDLLEGYLQFLALRMKSAQQVGTPETP